MRVNVRDDDGLFLGLRPETRREIVGIGLMLIGLFCCVSVFLAGWGREEVGPVGLFIGDFLIICFGQFLAVVYPAFLIWHGLNVIRRRQVESFRQKFISANLIMIALCVLMALPFAGQPELKKTAFRMGGIMGVFFLQDEGLGLLNTIGVVGCSLLFGWILATGLMICFNFLFFDMTKVLGTWIRMRVRGWTAALDPPRWPLRLPSVRRLSLWGRRAHSQPAVQAGENDRGSVKRDERSVSMPEPRVYQPHVQASAPASHAVPAAGDPSAPAFPASAPAAAPLPPAANPAAAGRVTLAVEDDEPQRPDYSKYKLPPITILADAVKTHEGMSKEEIKEISELLERTLADYNIAAQVVNVTEGPVVTRFELQPAPGVKINRIVNLENDLAMVLRAQTVRIVAPIPGKAAVGLEVPNPKREFVTLKSLLQCPEFKNHSSPLALCLGKGIDGKPVIADLAAMPHLLIAGATGSGKSVCMNTLICSILFRMPPDKVRFLMIDPKRVEFNDYQGIPHLLAPVVHAPKKASAALEWAVEQMEHRYERLVELNARNIDSYNNHIKAGNHTKKKLKLQHEYMPHIVILIDELADLMLIARNEVEESIQRLAQMSRAVGIHLVLATQRPSVNVITGIIKANFPTRIAFQVSSKVDSRTILDMNGAEALLGKGDMLFSAAGATKPIRIQGAFVSEDEVLSLTTFLREQAMTFYEMMDFETKEERALKARLEVEQIAMEAKLAALGGQTSLAGQFVLNQPIEKDASGEAHSVDYDGGGDEAPAAAVAAVRSCGAAEVAVEAQPGEDVASVGAVRVRPSAVAAGPGEAPASRPGAAMPRPAPSGPPVKPGGTSRTHDFMVDEDDIDEELLRAAIKLVLENNKASVSLIQRRMKVGFARAGRLMDAMEERGIVGPYQGSKPREILVDPKEFLARMRETEL
ncbi:MAG: hypothetical protein Kow0059_07920 [Candidatus Sumerlaeia bacterium]